MIDADAKNVDDIRIELGNAALGKRLDRVVEARTPTQHAKHQRPHESALALQQDRGKRRLALDTLKQLKRALAIVHQSHDCTTERLEVLRIHQHAVLSILDLIGDASDAARNHRTRLPHSFGDGEAKTLGQALLHDHVGSALQRVDHGGVLVLVIHRQLHDEHARCDRSVERLMLRQKLLQDLGLLGVVTHRR